MNHIDDSNADKSVHPPTVDNVIRAPFGFEPAFKQAVVQAWSQACLPEEIADQLQTHVTVIRMILRRSLPKFGFRRRG